MGYETESLLSGSEKFYITVVFLHEELVLALIVGVLDAIHASIIAFTGLTLAPCHYFDPNFGIIPFMLELYFING